MTMTSVPEQIRDILRYLSLTKMQLKDVCTVSRQTLYDWLAGKLTPEGPRSSRLLVIHELALLVPQHSRVSIRAIFLSETLGGKESLLQMLNKPNLDLPQLRERVVALARLSDEFQQKSAKAMCERLGFSMPDNNSQQANLDHNFDDLEIK